MDKYKEWLSKEMPLQLYHYTTKEGFLGIIKTKQIWASHILYQNDFTEYKLALDILKETINNNKDILKNYSIDANILIDELDKWLNKSVYVVSLSENNDVLSQWRGYANSTPGFCIGFKRNYLNKLKEDNNFVIAKCIYDEAEQNSFILELLVDSVNKLNNSTNDPNLTLSSQIAWRMIRYAPLIKHNKFKEENEWRIIISNINIQKDNNFDIRVGRSYFIPYYKLDFKNQEVIGDIYIGPCPDKDMAYKSTLFSCYANDIEFLKSEERQLFESKIPFRNW